MDELLLTLSAGIDRDRARPVRRRWILAAIAASCALAIGAVALRRTQASIAPSCENDERALVGIWDSATRAALRSSFVATRLEYAKDAYDHFDRRADEYVAAWRQGTTEACLASQIRRSQTQELSTRRAACLDNALASFEALVALLRTPDKERVLSAPLSIASLPAVADCADTARLQAAPARPTDAAERVRLASYQAQLNSVRANYSLGRNGRALAEANELLAAMKAAEFSYAPLESELYYWRGRAGADLGDDVALSSFEISFARAIAASDWWYLSDAAIRLAQELMFRNKLDEYDRWDRIARAGLIHRGSPAAEAFLDQLRCMSLYWSGKNMSRLRCMRALQARARPDTDLAEWQLSVLGTAAAEAGEVLEAVGYLKQAVDTSTRMVGAEHPRTLEMRAYLANGYLEADDPVAAEREAAEALAVLARVAPDDIRLRTRLGLYRGIALIKLHREAEGEPLIKEATHAPDETADLAVRALTSAQEGRDPVKQLAAAREALVELSKLAPAHPNVIEARTELAEACLATHDVKCAEAALTPLEGLVDETELNPLLIACVARTRGDVASKTPSKRADARAYFKHCLDILGKHRNGGAERDRRISECTSGLAKLDGTPRK